MKIEILSKLTSSLHQPDSATQARDRLEENEGTIL